MRVISGSARGRPLKAVPGNGTRPTADKVKEAMFQMIGPYFDGEQVLDLFAGTGGLGIEALSRGAAGAVFVDLDPKAVATVRANLAEAKPEGAETEVYRNDAMRALKALARRGCVFDLIFLDPPYRMRDADQYLLFMDEHGMVRAGAKAVIEHESSAEYPEEIGRFSLAKRSDYGDTAVSIYRYAKEVQ